MKFYKKYSKMIGSLHVSVPPCQIPLCRMPWPQPRKVIHWFGPITLEAKAAANAQYGSGTTDTQQPHKTVPFGFQMWLEQTCHRPLQKTATTYSLEKNLKRICSRTITLKPTWIMSSKNYLVARTGTIHGPNQTCYVSFFGIRFSASLGFFLVRWHANMFRPIQPFWFLRKLICTSGTGGLFAIQRRWLLYIWCAWRYKVLQKQMMGNWCCICSPANPDSHFHTYTTLGRSSQLVHG